MKFKVEFAIFRQGPSGDTERVSNLPKGTQPVARPAHLSLTLCSYLPPSLPEVFQPTLPLALRVPNSACPLSLGICDYAQLHTSGLASPSSCPVLPKPRSASHHFRLQRFIARRCLPNKAPVPQPDILGLPLPVKCHPLHMWLPPIWLLGTMTKLCFPIAFTTQKCAHIRQA